MRPSCVIAGVVIVGDCETPGDEATSGSIAFARPKSSTFTVPSGRILMFAGFRSRCTMPRACAASSASAICFATGQRLVEWNGPLLDAIGNGRPIDQLHHESGLPVGPLESVDGGDVGVIQGREDFRFTLKPREPIDIFRHCLRQDFDGDVPLQIRVCGPIHFAHPAGADLASDFIGANTGAW